MPIPVALLFDKRIIKHKNVFFLNGGGGNLKSDNQVITTRTDDPTIVREFNWRVIMGREPYREYQRLMKDFGSKWKEEITNMRNAEFHYPNRIETDYIDKIFFRSNAEMKSAQLEQVDTNDIPMIVDENKFCFQRKHEEAQHRREYDINFLNDFYLKMREDYIDIELMLKYEVDGYEHKIIVEQDNRGIIQVFDLLQAEKSGIVATPFERGFSLRIPFKTVSVRLVKYCLNEVEYTLWRKL